MWRKRDVLMDEAGAAGGAGGAAGAAAGAGEAAAAPAGGAGSALSAGAAAGAGAVPNFDWLPEKYRVNAADGALDLSASAQKLAGGYGELSKRMGDGGAPPATAGEYQVSVPDALKEQMGDLAKDAAFTKFRDDMHAAGLSQKQFDGVMAKYFELVPAIAAGAAQYTSETATADLKKVWTDDAAFQKNIGLAYRAGSAVASAAGMSFDDLEKAGLSNNPTFIRLMASLGPEFAEDAPPGEAGAGSLMSEDDVKKLLISEANTNPKHPDHKATRARIDAYYNRKYGTTPIV
ncbi:hypothetical protein GIY62_06435 [Burkholderia plantarii]|nr:hypothetical protein GIY62_06435 [Burkholderia plantarii]